jgi:hypothetical protein
MDIKIRWNSTLEMIRRFLHVVNCVNITLEELNSEKVSENEIVVLKEFITVMTPIALAIEKLCSEDSSILTAEGVYKYIFEYLESNDSELSRVVYENVKKRMFERRQKILISLLMFLKNGEVPKSTRNFDYSSETDILKKGVEIFNRIFPCYYKKRTLPTEITRNLHWN